MERCTTLLALVSLSCLCLAGAEKENTAGTACSLNIGFLVKPVKLKATTASIGVFN